MSHPSAKEVRAAEQRSLSQLVRELANDGANLIRQEIALARAELTQNLGGLARHARSAAVGAGVALVGLLVLVAFLVIGLGALLGGAYWLSALIVALVLVATGGGLALSGVRQLGRAALAPEESIDSVRATRRWIGTEVGELRATLSGNGRMGAAAPELRIEPRRPEPSLPALPAAGAHRPGRRRGAPKQPLSDPLYKRLLHQMGDDDMTGQGAKVAFFMFTSLPPALLVLFALSGFFGGEQLASFLTAHLENALPGSADDPDSATGFLRTFVDQVVQRRAPGPLSIGLIAGLWAASAVFVALTDSLNIAFDVPDDRPWMKRRAIAIGTMLAFLVLFIAGSVALLAGPQIAAALALGGAADLAWSVLQWPIAFLLVIGAFFLVYYLLPNRDQSGLKWILFKSSAIAAALWLLATVGFRLYVSNFGRFGETYGFVGAILVLLLWMYVTSIVILAGGEIASEMEREA
jgi:membrane protein